MVGFFYKCIQISFALAILSILSCNTSTNKRHEARELLESAIKTADSNSLYFNSTQKFKIDDLHYTLTRQQHIKDFKVERFKDSMHYIATYENGFTQYIVNDSLQEHNFYSIKFNENRLEGFAYTYGIPHVLQQNDVILEKKEDALIRNTWHHVVHVSFKKQEGFQDNQFYLYINPATNYVTYYAQKYQTQGEVLKFIRRYNFRRVNGILFYDQYVFTSGKDTIPLNKMYEKYNSSELKTLFHYELNDITVIPL